MCFTKLFAVFITLSLLFLSCSDDPVATTSYLTGNIVGRVNVFDEYNTILGDLGGTTVQLIGTKTYTTTTDINGIFTFKKVDPGIYEFTATATDHHPYTVKQIQFVGNGTLELGEIQLDRAWFNNSATFIISIINEQGKFTNDSEGLVLTLSNTSGFSKVVKNERNIVIDSLPEGTLTVIAEKDGFVYDSTTFESSLATQFISLRVFKPFFNTLITTETPEFNKKDFGQYPNTDSLLTVSINVSTDIDWASKSTINCLLLHKPSISSRNDNLIELTAIKSSPASFIFKTDFRKNAQMILWHSEELNSEVTPKEKFYFYITNTVRSFSPEHTNYRFPDGITSSLTKIVPFTIPK